MRLPPACVSSIGESAKVDEGRAINYVQHTLRSCQEYGAYGRTRSARHCIRNRLTVRIEAIHITLQTAVYSRSGSIIRLRLPGASCLLIDSIRMVMVEYSLI